MYVNSKNDFFQNQSLNFQKPNVGISKFKLITNTIKQIENV